VRVVNDVRLLHIATHFTCPKPLRSGKIAAKGGSLLVAVSAFGVPWETNVGFTEHIIYWWCCKYSSMCRLQSETLCMCSKGQYSICGDDWWDGWVCRIKEVDGRHTLKSEICTSVPPAYAQCSHVTRSREAAYNHDCKI
jgi:hypothetical protein